MCCQKWKIYLNFSLKETIGLCKIKPSNCPRESRGLSVYIVGIMGNVNFSLEVTTRTVLDDLPKINDIYVTFLPGTDYKDVIKQSVNLVNAGYNAIPHFPARSIKNLDMLKEFVSQIKEGGVKQVLIIGGDRDILGDYHCSLQLIETGLFDGLKIGIAGHPEGSPNMDNETIEEAMKSKAKFADYIVTQWTQDTDAITDYVNRMPLPVHIGVAGPASIKTLVKFAGFVGLKNSLNFAKKNAGKIFDLLNVQTPDDVIQEVKDKVNNFHIYAFGGIKKTKEWLEKENYYV